MLLDLKIEEIENFSETGLQIILAIKIIDLQHCTTTS